MKYFFLTIFLTIVIFGTNFINGLLSENTTDGNIVYIEKRYADNIKRRVARALTKDRVMPTDEFESSSDFMRHPRGKTKFGNKRFDRKHRFDDDEMFGGSYPESDESYYGSEEDNDSGGNILDYQYKQY